MRRTFRRVACVVAVAFATAASASPVHAAPVETGGLWVAPSSLSATGLRYGSFLGTVDAYRVTDGTSVCVHFVEETHERNGDTRFDVIGGCHRQASGVAFYPLRWVGTLSVGVPVQRWTRVERADGTVVDPAPVPHGVAQIDLRWTGQGNTRVHREVRSTLGGIPVHVELAATKRASVRGTLRIADNLLQVSGVAGRMSTGVEA